MQLDTAPFSDQSTGHCFAESGDLALQFSDGRSLRVSTHALGLASAVLDGLIEDIELCRIPELGGHCSNGDRWGKDSLHVPRLPVSALAFLFFKFDIQTLNYPALMAGGWVQGDMGRGHEGYQW